MLFDEADENAVLYYASANNEIVATIRSQFGTEGSFKASDNDFFGISTFETVVAHEKVGIVDRLIVDKNFRRDSLAHEIMQAAYIGSLKGGTKVCFITCDDKLLPLYIRYGFRVYTEPVHLPTGEKRNRMVLFYATGNICKKYEARFYRTCPKTWMTNNTTQG